MTQPRTGYKKRPLELIIIALVFALVPAINLVGWVITYALKQMPYGVDQILAFNLLTQGFGPWGVMHMITLISIWLLFWITAVGVYLVKPWGFFLCVFTAAVNWVFSILVFKLVSITGPLNGPTGIDLLQPTALTNLIFFIPVLVILQRDLLAPFFNPRLKWWEQHKRIKAALHIEATIAGQTQTFKTFDVSALGLFLATDNLPDLKIGQTFPAIIHLDEKRENLSVTCKVVWLNPGSAAYPTGLGCTFVELPAATRRTLGQYIAARKDEHELHHRA